MRPYVAVSVCRVRNFGLGGGGDVRRNTVQILPRWLLQDARNSGQIVYLGTGRFELEAYFFKLGQVVRNHSRLWHRWVR